MVEQKANCRNSIQITFGGETKCLEVWAREKNLDARAVNTRRKKGVRLPELFDPTTNGYFDWNAQQKQKRKDGTIKRHAKKGVLAL
jgi:hypothetical protein